LRRSTRWSRNLRHSRRVRGWC